MHEDTSVHVNWYSKKVRVFKYTQHFVEGKLSEKIGTCCLFRRAVEGRDVVIFLIESGGMTKLTSDTLTRLLEMHGSSARKNLTKANKIRHLMKLPIVQGQVSADDLATLEQQVQAMEKRNKRKANAEQLQENDEEAHLA